MGQISLADPMTKGTPILDILIHPGIQNEITSAHHIVKYLKDLQ